MKIENANMVIRKQLSAEELTDIKNLANICNQYEGLDLKLNYEMLAKRKGEHPEDFLCYLDGKLIGFLAVFSFHPAEAEISGMVHPDYRQKGIFSSLADLAIKACEKRGIPKLLFISEVKSVSGMSFIQSTEAEYSFSEYVMYLKEKAESYQVHPLALHEATRQDAEDLVRLNVKGFHMPEESAREMTESQLGDSARVTYVVSLNGEKIGKISFLDEGDRSAFIFGFVVDPMHQGKGYGRQIMMETVERLRADDFSQIGLEVAVKNKNALKLYESCGFAVTTAMDYYMIPLT